MDQNKTGRLGDRPKWVLRLLYAPAGGEIAKPIVGTTRLMKACFLVDRKMKSEFGVDTDFSFHPDQYGPLDELVYDTVEKLGDQGLVQTGESNYYTGTEYSLTEDGRNEAKVLFEELPDEQQDMISWIKSKHVLKSLSKLLSFVYNQYPEMAKNSKIA